MGSDLVVLFFRSLDGVFFFMYDVILRRIINVEELFSEFVRRFVVMFNWIVL